MLLACSRSRNLVLCLAVLICLALPARRAGAQGRTVHINWYKSPLADQLQLLANTYAQEHPGIAIAIDEVPQSQWYSNNFGQFARHKTNFAAMVMASQWLGEAVTKGYVRELSGWLQRNVNIQDFYPFLLAAYSQYPQRLAGQTGSLSPARGHFWGIPWQGDAMGFAYRKDLFADPANQRAFQARYHHPLAVPQSMDEIVEIADFFTHPAQRRYGIALYQQADGGAAAESFNAWCWNYGGDLWDAGNGQVPGVVNGPRCVHALALLDHLTLADSPPSMRQGGSAEAVQAMSGGSVAMLQGWWGGMSGLFDPARSSLGQSQSQIGQRLGFFNLPGETYQGSTSRWTPLGGDGLAISAYAPAADQAAVLDFARWFLTPEVQTLWYQAGGGTVSKSVLSSQDFQGAEPWYPLVGESYTLIKDFWNIPEFSRMLPVLTDTIHDSMLGRIAPQPALDAVARAQAAILRATRAYPYYGTTG